MNAPRTSFTSETGTMLSHVLGVECESDGREGFVGWIERLNTLEE